MDNNMINASIMLSKDKYSDKLYEAITEIELEIDKILQYCFNGVSEPIKNFLEKIKQELFAAGFDEEKLKLFYQKRMSNMREEYINDLNKNCKGYYLFSDDLRVISQASSINELLHAIHHCLINNEEMYEGILKLDEFDSKNGKLTLRGFDNEDAKNIFQKLKNEELLSEEIKYLDEEDYQKRRKNRGIFGETDIISLNDRILIMARNCGHALMIEINIKDNNYQVDYFIPKLNNIDMINKLPGIRKVSEEDFAATGNFDCNKEDLAYCIIKLIGETPRDFDNDFVRRFMF